MRPIAEVDPKARQVQIQGRARARRIQRCPITDRAVIGYRIRIEALDREGHWVMAVEMTRLQEFELYDESGEALVHWLGPLVLAGKRSVGGLSSAIMRPSFFELLNLDKASFSSMLRINPLDGRGLIEESLRYTKRVRYWATILEHESEVFVCGSPVTRLNPRGATLGYRQSPTQLLIRSVGGRPLLLADCTKSFLIDTLETRLLD